MNNSGSAGGLAAGDLPGFPALRGGFSTLSSCRALARHDRPRKAMVRPTIGAGCGRPVPPANMPVTRSSAANRPSAGRGPQRPRRVAYPRAACDGCRRPGCGRRFVAGVARQDRRLSRRRTGAGRQADRHLNELSVREDLLPVLALYPDPASANSSLARFTTSPAAGQRRRHRRIRVTREELAGRGLQVLRDRLKDRESMRW